MILPRMKLNDQAFAPHKRQDTTGISVSRARFKSVVEAAKGRPGKSYYVAVLRAGELILSKDRIGTTMTRQIGSLKFHVMNTS
jgi:hypothetical protein